MPSPYALALAEVYSASCDCGRAQYRRHAEPLTLAVAAQVKAEREARSTTFAALQKESLEALHEAATFDASCAECAPGS